MCHTPQGSGMSRINHLQRRDGRYWANIRFDAFRNSGEHRKHLRFSLRTSDLRVAQFRLASIMPRILAQNEPLDNNTEIYGTRRDLDNPMEEPRHYYSEEDFNTCPWRAGLQGSWCGRWL